MFIKLFFKKDLQALYVQCPIWFFAKNHFSDLKQIMLKQESFLMYTYFPSCTIYNGTIKSFLWSSLDYPYKSSLWNWIIWCYGFSNAFLFQKQFGKLSEISTFQAKKRQYLPHRWWDHLELVWQCDVVIVHIPLFSLQITWIYKYSPIKGKIKEYTFNLTGI